MKLIINDEEHKLIKILLYYDHTEKLFLDIETDANYFVIKKPASELYKIFTTIQQYNKNKLTET